MDDLVVQDALAKELRRICGIPNPLALAHYSATSPTLQERAVLIVVNDDVERALVAQALAQFQPLAHPRPIITWDDSPITQALNLITLQHQIGYCVAERSAVDDPSLPAPTQFNTHSLRLSVGDTLSETLVKEFLTGAGFERETTANAPGLWASRGDIIDIHLEHPLRMTFDGDTIESLTIFDIGTGKTVRKIPSVTIPSLTGIGRSSLLNYLPADTLILAYHQEKIDTTHEQWLIEPLASPDAIDAGYTETRAYHLRYEEMHKDAANKTVYLFTSDAEKAKAIFSHIPKKQLHVQNISTYTQGFIHEKNAVIAFTDVALGIFTEREKKQSRRVQQALIQHLSPGDYVVHLYHGIARFSGMHMMHVNGLQREYFVLEYAGTDKIYVPVELADRIDKYVGEAQPTLHRLSDASWHEVVARVKEQSLEMARELLQLYARRSQAKAHILTPFETEEAHFDALCSFRLTTDQASTLQDIYEDCTHDTPMDRLLCGDVGFGKTEVAMRTALRVVLNGYQVAVLAPTTVLVQQHFDTFTERFKPFGITVEMLSRVRTDKQQKETLEHARAGTIPIVIGTHRLLSRDVQFKKIGLIIIDEEQRFGVKAKEALKKIRKNAHVLTMTATPIPRTLHLSLSGIRNISTILTPPNERKAVETSITRYDNDIVVRAVTRELERKGQTYYIYNRVESIDRRKRELEQLLPNARIAIAHGQMPPQALARVMHAFDVGEVDVLLATTIVENGLDIPNANTLIVENASMFGLGELYQLKGRVGRSHQQGYAYFLYKEQVPDGDVKKRFIALNESQGLGAGFELAMRDMEIRGIGNILGKEQSGHAVKIGMNLYVRLLNQAVKELEGLKEEPERDIPIDLPIEARIPEDRIPQAEERITLYQQLANIRDEDELEQKQQIYTQDPRFQKDGILHPVMRGLFDILEIKLSAARSSLLSMDTTYPNTLNQLQSPRITITSETPFTRIDPPWELLYVRDDNRHKIRATLDELGDDWISEIKKAVKACRILHNSEDDIMRSNT